MELTRPTARIGVKLPLVVCVLVALAIGIVTSLAHSVARDAVAREAAAKLQSAGDLTIRQIESLLGSVERDLVLTADSPVTVLALGAMARAFSRLDHPARELRDIYIHGTPTPSGEREAPVTAGAGNLYAMLHAQFHPVFDQHRRRAGYDDILMIDTEGNLVYSASKGIDFASNLLTGEWKETALADAFRRALDIAVGDRAVFQDFQHHPAGQGAQAAVFARPVLDRDGRRLGVLAYRVPVDMLDAAMLSDVLGETGGTFLVGSDRLLRGISRHGDADILATQPEIDAVDRALSGERSTMWQDNPTGDGTLAYIAPVEVQGTSWAVVVKTDARATFAPIDLLLRTSILIGIVILALALAVTHAVSRSITRPLGALACAMERLGRGEHDATVPGVGRKDEIGDVARAVEKIRRDLADASEHAHDEAFRSAAYEVTGTPMFLVDRDFNIVSLNGAARRTLRERLADFRTIIPDFDPDNLVGRNMDMFHAHPSKARSTLAHPDRLPVKMKIAVGDAYLGLLVDQLKDRQGTHVGFIVEWKDQTYTTAHQVVISAIDAQQCRLEASLDGRIKSINARFCDLLGRQPAELIGTDVGMLVTPETGDCEIWSKVGAGDSVFGSFRVGCGAQTRIIDGSVSTIPDHRGKPNGFLVMGVDATDMHAGIAAAEARRRQMEADQAQVVDALNVNLKRLSEGDLKCTIDQSFAEDYEGLRQNFNDAITKLQAAMRCVVTNAAQIDDEAAGISAAVGDLSHRTERQAATLEETAAAVEQLTGSVSSTARGARYAADIASEARRKAEDGGAVVRQAVSAMHEIEKSSHAISKIIGAINTIAFQTNLLALNAGVEAARAGDAGRGFAVVASEVRALAQRSAEAAREIKALVTSSGEQVERGVSLVADAREALDRIVVSVREISSVVNDIAVSAADQSSGIGEINAAMNELDVTTQRNAAMVEEATATTQTLAGEAQKLVEITALFAIGGDGVHRSAPRASASVAAEQVFRQATRPAAAQMTGGPGARATYDPDGWEDV